MRDSTNYIHLMLNIYLCYTPKHNTNLYNVVLRSKDEVGHFLSHSVE